MTKKDFIKKWSIDDTSVYYYKKRFPEIYQNKTINYSMLNSILEERTKIKETVKILMKDKKAYSLEFLFEGKNKKVMAHNFLNQLLEEKEQILVRDSNYKKYLQILKHFGEEHGRD